MSLFNPRILITMLLVFASFLALPALSFASGATMKIADRSAASRLEVTLEGFSDKGSWRITSVAVTSSQKKVFALSRSGKNWVTSWQKSIANLRGTKVKLVVRRRNRTSFVKTIMIASKPLVVDPPVVDPPVVDPPVVDPPVVDPPITETQIQVDSLSPRWSAEITDFTVACDQPVVVRVRAFEPLSVDGGASQSGSFSKEVALTPGQSFKISGAFDQTVRCRPADMMLPESEVNGPRQAAFYMVAPTIGNPSSPYMMIFNNQGVPVWWLKETRGVGNDFKLMSDSTVAFWHGWGSAKYDIVNLNGSLSHEVSAINYVTDLHDMQQTSDGGFLTMSYVPRDCPNTLTDCEDLSPWGGSAVANITDAVIQKQDGAGNLLWTWNSRDHIALAESAPWIPALTSPYDIVHINSFEEDGDGIVFSARHLDAVYRITDPGGAGPNAGDVDWKLGGTTTAESLTSIDNPLAPNVFSGQHDARILSDGTLTVHNNGTRLGFQPRAVQYQLDTTSRTATLIDSLTDSDIPGSGCCGGARHLPLGGWAVSWGIRNLVGEYDNQGKRVFALHYPPGAFSYRVVPVLANQLSALDLRQGMNDQFPR